ncbi:rhamnogalacturonidase [Massilia phyllosphaerae]|uniref:rhamnogalacturonidase n=1 Tax=Massilia phyllosphaerae TaxID=3106034 RepID=UPI002B1CB01A|nr:glycosyl hydrolase family 28-related protein [Massilia sp. SGZ-792]
MIRFQPVRRRALQRILTALGATAAGALTLPSIAAPLQAGFNVRTYGARGDGATLDTDAINAAIAAASAAGGGTVWFPAGRYLSFSIRLRSNVALYLDAGSVIVAADPALDKGRYDDAEPNPWDPYQDFGHSHWHNSLLWGEGLDNVAILGPGRIWGRGLTRSGPGANRSLKAGDMPSSLKGADPMGERARKGTMFGAEMAGKGNKAIALKNCRNVQLRDFSMLKCGHFAVLATGVDNLVIDNLMVDTDRDGFDIDCCRNVRIANCAVNTPNDDAICLKSSYALGKPRFTEHVTITGCQVSGFDLGTLLDGTFGKTQLEAPDKEGVCGRIKLGTESNGGFRNIAIANCVFEHCRGLAIESVDGAVIEDVTVDNLAMRDLTTAPLFIRLGRRMRAPAGTRVGAIRRVNISNVVVSQANAPFASIVAGLPEAPVEDVRISNLTVVHGGGGSAADAVRQVPEEADHYPEPSMFGVTPAYGLYVRHARNLEVHHADLRSAGQEGRPPVLLDDVDGAGFDHVRFARGTAAATFVLRGVRGLAIQDAQGLADLARSDHARAAF